MTETNVQPIHRFVIFFHISYCCHLCTMSQCTANDKVLNVPSMYSATEKFQLWMTSFWLRLHLNSPLHASGIDYCIVVNYCWHKLKRGATIWESVRKTIIRTTVWELLTCHCHTQTSSQIYQSDRHSDQCQQYDLHTNLLVKYTHNTMHQC